MAYAIACVDTYSPGKDRPEPNLPATAPPRQGINTMTPRHLFSGRPRLITCFGLILALLAASWMLRPAWFGAPWAAPEGRPLSVMTLNIGSTGQRKMSPQEVADMVHHAENPDIVCLQEVVREIRDFSDFQTATGYAYAQTDPADDPEANLLILSRTPLRMPEHRTFQARETLASGIAATTTVGDTDICFVCTHLDPTPKHRDATGNVLMGPGETVLTAWRELTQETPRSRCAGELLDWLGERPRPTTIIAGDFNTIAASKTVRRITSRYLDSMVLKKGFFSGTYAAIDGPLQPRIDYIFMSRDLSAQQSVTLENPYGDHRAVVARVILPRQNEKKRSGSPG